MVGVRSHPLGGLELSLLSPESCTPVLESLPVLRAEFADSRASDLVRGDSL